ncbi:hypothetical protein M432DRAFT_674956 [Thermoascus aurantiacus ATCC 26904]
MSRRASPRDWYEEDIYERDRYSNDGRREFVVEDDVDYRRRISRPPDRESERPRARDRSIPDFLRESYEGGRDPGTMVLRRREREDSEFQPRERSREAERGRDETLRRRASERGRRLSREAERDERRNRRRPVESDIERDEVFARRRDRSWSDYEHDEGSRKRGREDRSPPSEFEQDEVIVRHTDRKGSQDRERERDDFHSRATPHSHSKSRRRSESREGMIIRRDRRHRDHGRGDAEDDEIVVRKRETRSPSSEQPHPRDPPPIRAPPIHREVITHHRHIDHGFDMAGASRAPSPEFRLSRDSVDEFDIHRRGERHGRSYRISVDRREKDELPHTLRRRSTDPYRREKDEVVILRVRPRSRERQRELVIREREGGRRHAIDRRDERDIREEADYYTRRNADCAHIGEAYNGATKDWTIIDVPPGTKRVTLDGIGGASQEISWQRYNGARRSNFVTDGEDFTSDHETDREVGRVGRRYVKVKDRRDRLWTEITKDLVVREAIERAGYEYEETEYFYYIFAYLRYEDIAALVDLSEEIRAARRERIHEIHRERVTLPPLPAVPLPPPAPRPPPPPRSWDEERSREHELVVEKRRRTPSGSFW